MAMRARIVMSCANGEANRAVVAEFGVSEAVVGK
jgi:hypothetical protein